MVKVRRRNLEFMYFDQKVREIWKPQGKLSVVDAGRDYYIGMEPRIVRRLNARRALTSIFYFFFHFVFTNICCTDDGADTRKL